MAKQIIEVVVQDKTARALGNINNRVDGLARSFGGVTTAAKGFVALLGAREIIQFATSIKDTTAEFQNYRNQLRLVTDGQEDLNRVFNLLTQAAVNNRTSFGETVDLFTKLRVSTEALGISEERVIAVTGKLSQALQVAGADGNTAASVIRQFGQAMASGEVRGDEFRSLVEGLGPALSIMARESGITVGELRKMSQAGELTAEALFKMLENSNSLAAAFQTMNPTIDQLETRLGDAFDRAVVKIAEATGATALYEDVISNLTRSLNQIAGTQGLPENMSVEELQNFTKNGISAAQALDELTRRLEDLPGPLEKSIQMIDDNFFSDLFGRQSELEALLAAYRELLLIVEKQKALAEEAKAAAEAQQALNDAIANATRPFSTFIKLAENYEKTGFGSALDKNEEKIRQVREALEQLVVANQTVIEANGQKVISDERLIQLTRVLELELAALTEQNQKLRDAQNDLVSSGNTYADFLANLKKTTQENLTQTEFQKRAITDISALYRDGAVSLEYYEAAMKSLNMEEHLGINTKNELIEHIDRLNEKYSEFFNNAENLATKQALKDIEIFKDALDQKIISEEEFASKKLAIEESLAREIENIQTENQKKLDDLYLKSIEKRLKAGQTILNERDKEFLQRKGQEEKTSQIVNDRIEFEKKSELEKTQFGISQAKTFFTALGQQNKKFFAAMKAFAIAEAIINTYQGATKALATYPPPFNFIAAAAVVASGLAQVSAIRAQTAQRGGKVIGGQPAVVGEDGPELIVPKQGSTVIPREVADAIGNMGGSNQPVVVNFNISTVDAQGFDELLIRRRGTITGIINNALQKQGKQGVIG